jgi:hypothetical protein
VILRLILYKDARYFSGTFGRTWSVTYIIANDMQPYAAHFARVRLSANRTSSHLLAPPHGVSRLAVYNERAAKIVEEQRRSSKNGWLERHLTKPDDAGRGMFTVRAARIFDALNAM